MVVIDVCVPVRIDGILHHGGVIGCAWAQVECCVYSVGNLKPVTNSSSQF